MRLTKEAIKSKRTQKDAVDNQRTCQWFN